MCEKCLATRKDVFWGFIDLEKAYHRHVMRQILRVYGVGGEML